MVRRRVRGCAGVVPVDATHARGRIRRVSAGPSVRVRDAEATRGKLLAAGTDVFAHKGLAGARLREIADLAGVTVPLLCHHFKDKDTLYAAVVERAVGRFVGLGWDILGREGSFRQRIIALVHGLVDLLAADPTMTLLLHRDLADGGDRAQTTAEAALLPLRETAIRVMRAAQERGELRSDFDPDMLLLHVASAAVYPAIASTIIGTVWGGDPLGQPMLERRKRGLLELVIPRIFVDGAPEFCAPPLSSPAPTAPANNDE